MGAASVDRPDDRANGSAFQFRPARIGGVEVRLGSGQPRMVRGDGVGGTLVEGGLGERRGQLGECRFQLLDALVQFLSPATPAFFRMPAWP